MKRNLLLSAVLLASLISSPLSASSADQPTVVAPYQIVSSGPHQNVWQRTTVDSLGETNIQSYTELATGLNFYDPVSSTWQPSRELFQITPNGFAIATNGQHKVIIAADIATSGGAIDFLGPDGQRLLSSPRALVFHDVANNKSILLAQVTNCVGELSPPNVVVFPSAFDTVKAAISYTYRRAGLEQDVILYRRLPSPSDLSAELSPDSTVLEIWTEFLQAPDPAVMTSTRKSDPILDFGTTRMVHGVAYFQDDKTLQPVSLEKSWQNIAGRHFLVESISYPKIKPLLDRLQASATSTNGSATTKLIFGDRAKLVATAFVNKPSPVLAASIRPGHPSGESGVVLDYQVLNSAQTNFVFAADQTYFVSGIVTLTETNGGPAATIEGSTVIKFTNDPVAELFFLGSVRCQTGPYRMGILTSMNDDSVGTSIAGSTGSPSSDDSPTFLLFPSSGAFKYLRFSYAGTGIWGSLDDASGGIWHCQFINCATAMTTESDANLHNVLFSGCGTTLLSLDTANLYGEHVTADSVGTFWQPLYDGSATLANCILTAVTNLGPIGTLDHCATNSSSAGFYQSAGAGNYYLAPFSTNRGAGTALINSNLLAAIKQKTSYPPVIYSYVTNSINITLSPRVQRDTDAPDRGYLYDPLDYITDMFVITNAALTISPGTAIACYNWTGIRLQEGSSITCIGMPLAPNWLVGYQGVQEQPIALGGSTASWSVNAYHTGSPAPTGTFRFTRFVCAPGGGNQFHDGSWSFGSLLLRDSEVWGGVNRFAGDANTSQTLINNLFYRGTCLSSASVTNSLAVSNNLFWSVSTLELKPADSNLWSVYNNMFDSCSFFVVPGTVFHSGNNAYWNCNKQLSPTNASDIALSSAIQYQSGPLGDFYQTSSSPLTNAGSCTADLAGLFHHTLLTNIVNGAEIPETNSPVDVGVHYIAVDTNGLPIDTDGDSVPNYAEDTNGNGVFDTGDFGDWTRFIYNTASFTGISQNQDGLPPDWRPDTMGAVGSNHFVEMLNGEVAVYAKSNGTQLAYTNLNAFLRVTISSGQPYAGTYPDPQDANTDHNAGDPRILYDHVSQRWFACAIHGGSGHVLLAVSTNSDPLMPGDAAWISNQWKHYLVPMGLVPTGDTNSRSDYTRLGIDGNGVYIAATHYDHTYNTNSERFATLPKSPLLDGSATTVQTNFIFDYPASLPIPQPAVNFDAITTNDPAWFISPFQDTTKPFVQAIYYNRLTWTNGSSSRPTFDTNWGQLLVQSYSQPDDLNLSVPQSKPGFFWWPVTAAVRKINGTQYLWASRGIGLNSAGNGTNADRTAVEWFKIQTTPSVSIADTGRIFDTAATNPKFYYYPSLAVNTNGDMVIGFSGSSTNATTNDLVAAYYWGKLHNGGSNSAPVRYFPGRASTYSHGSIDTGDYSYTSLDPNDGLTIWTIQMYAETNSTGSTYTWGTAFAPVSPY